MSLEVSGVTHAFGEVRVLDDVSLRVGQGAVAAILGRSGCGKTTLLRIIAGLLGSDAGRVVVGGRDVSAAPAQRRRVSLVPQEGALFPHLDVAGNVGFGLKPRDRRARTTELLDLVGIADLARRMPHEISGGQAQRVAVARALAVNPELVLLDEPFSALDASGRADVREDLRRVLRESGTTAVLVTHDQEEALSMADHLMLMAGGRVVQQGTPAEVYARPANTAAAQLTGPALCVPATGHGRHADTLFGAVELHDLAVGPGMLVMRPEDLSVTADASVTALVTGITFYGHDADVHLRHSSGLELVARTQEVSCCEGETVGIVVSGRAVFVPA